MSRRSAALALLAGGATVAEAAPGQSDNLARTATADRLIHLAVGEHRRGQRRHRPATLQRHRQPAVGHLAEHRRALGPAHVGRRADASGPPTSTSSTTTAASVPRLMAPAVVDRLVLCGRRRGDRLSDRGQPVQRRELHRGQHHPAAPRPAERGGVGRGAGASGVHHRDRDRRPATRGPDGTRRPTSSPRSTRCGSTWRDLYEPLRLPQLRLGPGHRQPGQHQLLRPLGLQRPGDRRAARPDPRRPGPAVQEVDGRDGRRRRTAGPTSGPGQGRRLGGPRPGHAAVERQLGRRLRQQHPRERAAVRRAVRPVLQPERQLPRTAPAARRTTTTCRCG